MSDVSCEVAGDRQTWDDLIQRVAPTEFLQGWFWGAFQEAVQRRVLRLILRRDGSTVGAAQFVRHTTRFGRSFLVAPRGPIVDPGLPPDVGREAWTTLLRGIDERRTGEVMFLKAEPNTAPPDGLGFERGSGVHPERTLLLDLRRTEEELRSEMHSKTRYNIGLAERHGVRVRFGRDQAAVAAFLSLVRETAERQRISVYPASYYETMVATLGESIDVAIAEHGGQPLSAALLVRYGSTYTYVHGASTNRHRELMAPHLMQWESIRRGRSLGCATYDFFGIAPEGSGDDHPWAGITRFKLGFGGRPRSYPGAFNRIYRRGWYLTYRIAKRVAGR